MATASAASLGGASSSWHSLWTDRLTEFLVAEPSLVTHFFAEDGETSSQGIEYLAATWWTTPFAIFSFSEDSALFATYTLSTKM